MSMLGQAAAFQLVEMCLMMFLLILFSHSTARIPERPQIHQLSQIFDVLERARICALY